MNGLTYEDLKEGTIDEPGDLFVFNNPELIKGVCRKHEDAWTSTEWHAGDRDFGDHYSKESVTRVRATYIGTKQ